MPELLERHLVKFLSEGLRRVQALSFMVEGRRGEEGLPH